MQRTYQYVDIFLCHSSMPRNHNRLIDLRQAVTLTGLGSQRFHTAVRGVSAVYQAFKMHLSARGCQLRTWAPGCDAGQSLTLTFSNRILMSAKDAEGETKQDLGRVVDPFNILRPPYALRFTRWRTMWTTGNAQ